VQNHHRSLVPGGGGESANGTMGPTAVGADGNCMEASCTDSGTKAKAGACRSCIEDSETGRTEGSGALVSLVKTLFPSWDGGMSNTSEAPALVFREAKGKIDSSKMTSREM
jgi:hypothetical protein